MMRPAGIEPATFRSGAISGVSILPRSVPINGLIKRFLVGRRFGGSPPVATSG